MKRTTAIFSSMVFVLVAAVGTSALADTAPAAQPTNNTATPTDEKVLLDKEGNIIEGDDEYAEWVEEVPSRQPSKGSIRLMACPEVNDPPRDVYAKKRKFIIDKGNPFSSWLNPGQSIEYVTESQHEFHIQVTVGGEAEAGVYLAKAKSKLDINAGYKYVSKSGRKITDSNSTKKGYRVRLGNMGYRVTVTRHWIASPCKAKSKVIYEFIAPEEGDLSFGRFPE